MGFAISPDPVSIVEIWNSLRGHGSEKARTTAIRILSSVIHVDEIKNQLLKEPEIVYEIPRTLEYATPLSYGIRWECLAIMGELCRRESQQDTRSAKEHNRRAEGFIHLFTKSDAPVDVFQALNIISRSMNPDEEDIRNIALDLLSALPFHGELLTNERKRHCRNLLYLDNSPEVSSGRDCPRVARASNVQCNNWLGMECNQRIQQEAHTATGTGELLPSTPLLRCSACKAAFYCSTSCQKAHWKSHHRALCKASDLCDLFYPTRRDLYRRRPAELRHISFEDYFFQYFCPTI